MFDNLTFVANTCTFNSPMTYSNVHAVLNCYLSIQLVSVLNLSNCLFFLKTKQMEIVNYISSLVPREEHVHTVLQDTLTRFDWQARLMALKMKKLGKRGAKPVSSHHSQVFNDLSKVWGHIRFVSLFWCYAYFGSIWLLLSWTSCDIEAALINEQGRRLFASN